MITYTLKVVNIKRETEDAITVCFKQPAFRKIKYQAGQYLTLVFRINGRRYIRPYSFSSAPTVNSDLEVTVKRVQNGIVSNHIHDVLRLGDSIEVMSPMGDFVYNMEGTYSDQDQVFLWGVGSGITPLISLTKHILKECPSVNVNLVYGNRSYESMIFSELIDELQVNFSTRFKVWHFHTQLSITENSPFVIQGRITKTSVLDVMEGIKANRSLHYICGPLGLKESVKDALLSINTPVLQIFSEDFELFKDPRDFEDIQTRSIKLKFDNQLYDLEVVKGKSVLESALDTGIELPYSCQTGSCSTCKAVVRTGQLRMIGLTHLREDLLVDEYLLCCSHPLTNDVYLEV